MSTETPKPIERDGRSDSTAAEQTNEAVRDQSNPIGVEAWEDIGRTLLRARLERVSEETVRDAFRRATSRIADGDELNEGDIRGMYRAIEDAKRAVEWAAAASPEPHRTLIPGSSSPGRENGPTSRKSNGEATAEKRFRLAVHRNHESARRSDFRLPASRRTYFTDDAAGPLVLNPQRSFVRPLLAWHEVNGRHQLPWRDPDRSAFDILIAEILLQRTTAASVSGAYLPIIARFPSPEAVVAARPEAVERRIAPLGLAKRAEFVRRSSEQLLARHSGVLPHRYEDLLGLHGVGPYTARSVLIHAFDEDIAAVDTNVRRLISRFFDVSPDSGVLAHFADALAPSQRGSEFQHAMLDFAADVCTARTPECETCPLRGRCRSSEHEG